MTTSSLSAKPTTRDASGARPRRAGRGSALVVALVATALLLVGAVWALSLGSEHIGWSTVVHSWFSGDSPAELISRTIRMPRVVLAIIVGANLAVAGTVMQAVTANPVAAPDIMGVNAGAVVVVVAAITVVPSMAGA